MRKESRLSWIDGLTKLNSLSEAHIVFPEKINLYYMMRYHFMANSFYASHLKQVLILTNLDAVRPVSIFFIFLFVMIS